MTTDVRALTADLRRRFDADFAVPPRSAAAPAEELLALRAGGERYALRLRQAQGLYAERPITSLPGPVGALLGVAAFSGAIVPVYDLGALLGRPADPSPRWLVLAAGTPALAVAFAELDGHVRARPGDLVAEPDTRGGRRALRGMVALPGGTRPIVDLPAVRATVLALTGSKPTKESGDADG
ncbi:chemotaxis protein CheW [Spirilliplanes yamanashiensis]|uniref:chemotaxis protein CheW n=1 Tax=Spirilliplanes yamanashiensis TaxID=42233 RepID=UPI001950010A|nr:chemotaxis protein CheW [Spirilliplanes yamanashiensis]MDP9818021.1 purine-binding chemotaxis protein CheW [Spirilliplanes yamanashiensis]